jgi:hypothetical protein
MTLPGLRADFSLYRSTANYFQRPLLGVRPASPPVVDGGLPPGKRGCPDDLQRCGRKCVNIDNDPHNCGFCGHECLTGQDCCSGLCINTTTRSSCGACGEQCKFGEDCCFSPGAATPDHGPWECMPFNTTSLCGDCENNRACGPGEDCCFDNDSMKWQCAELGGDKNCSRCGDDCTKGNKVCSADRICVCPPGWTDCGGTCVFSLTTEEHCGRCDNACNPGERCCFHREAKKHECTPIGTTANCGDCEHSCGPGEACCGGDCADLQTSEAHCGRCNNPCDGVKVCQNGSCVCPSDRASCGGTCCDPGKSCCNGACVDLQSDINNCGVCGRVCQSSYTNIVTGELFDSSEQCRGGQCVCATPTLTQCGAISGVPLCVPTGSECCPQDGFVRRFCFPGNTCCEINLGCCSEG